MSYNRAIMPNSHTDHTQYSKQEIIAHCKKWLDGHRNDDMPTLLSDYIAATVETDILTYPITTQEWWQRLVRLKPIH